MVATERRFVLHEHLPAVRALGAFVESVRWEDLPASVQSAAKSRLLDTITCVLAGRETPPARLALALATGSGPASFWLSDATGSVQDCVFVNGILAHSALLDDSAPAHLGCVVPPAALAVGEAEGRSGAEILAGIAVGYEIGIRVDSRYLGKAITARGVRYSNVITSFGAGATAAYLMQLPARAVADTLALTVSLCPWGTYEPLGKEGSSERVVQIGAGVRAGVYGAELARAGFTGISTAFEGASGLYFTASGSAEPPAGLLEGLGDLWHLRDVVAKPYPCGTPNMYAIWCADRLVQEHGIRHEDVAAVEIRTPDVSGQRMVGIRDPGPFQNFEQAVTSCQFTVATSLVFGRYDVDSALQGLGDPRVDALAQRLQFVTVQPPYNVGAAYAAVTITLRDGRVLTAESSDMPKALLSPDWDHMVARFHELTAGALPEERREQALAEVAELELRPDCRALLECLR
jgi:2-methylcitrate dehydratase PrpD